MANKKNIEKLLLEAESQEIRDLKADNLRLLKQLEKAKRKKEDLIDAIYQAVSTNLRTWNKPKIPKPRTHKRTKDAEVAVAVLSDIQLAKVTPDYNTLVAEERVIEYANKIVELTNVQRSAHPVNKCVRISCRGHC